MGNGLISYNTMRAPFHARSAGGRQFTNYTPTFLADAMLGSLARKLRVFGYDTIYLSDVKDEVVLRVGITQNRVILTCDKESIQKDCKSRCERRFTRMFQRLR